VVPVNLLQELVFIKLEDLQKEKNAVLVHRHSA
jgi:hypothetical protein